MTIAISVLFSAFNALTLSPALAALLLRPREDQAMGCYGDFLTGLTVCLNSQTQVMYVGAAVLLQKTLVVVSVACRLRRAAGFFAHRVPIEFSSR